MASAPARVRSSGRTGRTGRTGSALGALGLALVCSSLGPWWVLSFGSGTANAGTSALRDSAWRSSGLWALAVVLGVGTVVAVLLTAPTTRVLAVSAAVSLVALVLVLWQWGSIPCSCGAGGHRASGRRLVHVLALTHAESAASREQAGSRRRRMSLWQSKRSSGSGTPTKGGRSSTPRRLLVFAGRTSER